MKNIKLKADTNYIFLAEVKKVIDKIEVVINSVVTNITTLTNRVTTLENNEGSGGVNFTNAKVYYNITPWEAGTGTANECQSFVEGKFLPINVTPFELSTATWRTYYITNWYYLEPTSEHPNGQTQIIYYASDTQSPIDLVGMEI